MDYVNLGKTGLKVSRLCLGMMSYGDPVNWRPWVLNEEQAKPFVKRAVEAGINFFDTANVYSLGVSEEITGRTLREYAKRDEIVVATKVFSAVGNGPNQQGLSRKHMMEQIDASLKRLGMDYVDLYQIHRFDPQTPVEETMEALHDIVKAGKARYIGASSMSTWQFIKMQHVADMHGWTRFVSMQGHYNLIYREEEREMIPYCRSEGIGLIPWSPLARGFLSGSRQRGSKEATAREKDDQKAHHMYYQEQDFQVADRVVEIAQTRGVTPAQIALAWLLHQPNLTAPIIGATKMNHLEEAIVAVEVKLSEEERQRLEELYVPHKGGVHS